MSVKRFELPGIGAVKLYKRKGVHTIRLSVTAAGEVRVTQPYWLPFEAGVRFAQSKLPWIRDQLQQKQPLLVHGQAIGKSHHLQFEPSPQATRVTTRIRGTIITISHPPHATTADPHVQATAKVACIRALRTQASMLLPQRLRTLAEVHSFSYHSISIKQLKGRWGSCDTDQNIVLNLYLMQLPWHLIDYVLLHELTHTKVLHHGPEFWAEFERHLPNAKRLRREIRTYQPTVGA